jgi:hypothetical protein
VAREAKEEAASKLLLVAVIAVVVMVAVVVRVAVVMMVAIVVMVAVAVEIGVPPRWWISSGGWTILSHGKRSSAQQ